MQLPDPFKKFTADFPFYVRTTDIGTKDLLRPERFNKAYPEIVFARHVEIARPKRFAWWMFRTEADLNTFKMWGAGI